jgi:hypothetical protein
MVRLQVLFPVFAVAIKPGSAAGADGASEGAPWLDGFVKKDRRSWTSRPGPSKLDWLLLTGGHRSINKVVALPFAQGASRPDLVVKLPRVREAIPFVAREGEVLGALSRVSGVPRRLFYKVEGSGVALGETYLGGQPVFTMLRRDNFRELALQTTDWLAQLVAGFTHQPGSPWWDRLVEPVLADFEASFGRVLDPGAMRQTRHALGRLDALPPVHEQRDFSPWNVLVDGAGELVVLDWESAELNGLPGRDLIYFLAYLAFFLEGAMESGRYAESYRALRDPGTFTGRVFQECWRRYCDRTGIDSDFLHPLCLLTWLLHARSEFSRLGADAGRAPDAVALRESLFFTLWTEELRQVAALPK